MSERWKKLSVMELRGAHYALRVVHTSPAIRGRGLEVLKELLGELQEEMDARSEKLPREMVNAPRKAGAWEPRNTFLKVGDSETSFKCECGCNVFGVEPAGRYRCNSCDAVYVGG